MAGSVSTEEDSSRPEKTPKLDGKAIVESKPSSTYARLRVWEPEKDEYVRQYLLFHYQFHKTQGFGIEWDKFDYFFNLCDPYDGAPPISGTEERSNEEVIKEVTLTAIDKYNQENGTNLVFVEHVSANFSFSGYLAHWITFWARDMSSPSHESKLYQVKTLERGGSFQIPIFRVKPTDEEMMAAPIHVDPPFPMYHDIDKPPIVFRLAGPGEVPVPGTPFVFDRDGVEVIGSDEDE
ncbi:hypothetical protein EUTSA_v10014562mg [Eutrema salsugineum]|uniref:Uncharacterized protein n=1 Tax=Eutrema salsugineum TaxID=72664 RepID=V4KXI4_EUTSA|nr:uncharacterized protein LOC18019206 [Eutrema salsugineum]ESQ42720.1 hypothetical protein EUTSA_v10014562mg [Eutrema salsugineum]